MKLIDFFKVGDRYNSLTYLSFIETVNETSFGLFRCDCGKEIKSRMSAVKSGHAKSCGCLQKKTASMHKLVFEEGQKIGSLIFLRRAEVEPADSPKGVFLCPFCEKEFTTRISTARDGRAKSCGCVAYKLMAQTNTKYERAERLSSGVKKMPALLPEDIERFWSKVGFTANPNSCWNWESNGDRYGLFSVGKDDFKSNRLAYFLHYGEDPADMVVMHSCDNPKCCNPKHLSLGTQWDNMQDMKEKGRATKSFKLDNYKL